MRIKSIFTIIGFLFFIYACGGDNQTAGFVPKIPVYSVMEQEIPLHREFVGQIYGQKDIAIRARVEGFLEGIHFNEGHEVEEGQLLYTVESQPYQAAEAAQLSKVAEARTMMAKAQSDLNRYKPLAAQKAVSQSALDAAQAEYDASVASLEAAKANLRAARIQLSYTRIISPINGIIGRTKARVGDFVGRDPNPVILNVVSQIDTMLVQFFITETQYLRIVRSRVELGQESIEHNREPNLNLVLSDGSTYRHKGLIDFIDREVDPTTGAILVQASFPNPDEILRPGQFAKIIYKVFTLKKGIAVPQRCIIEMQGLYNVFVVNDSGKVENRSVEVGFKIEDFWIIRNGLEAGEKVVYEGLQKVRQGGIVEPVVTEVKLKFNEE